MSSSQSSADASSYSYFYSSGPIGFETLTKAHPCPTPSFPPAQDPKPQGIAPPTLPLAYPSYSAPSFLPYQPEYLGYPCLPSYFGSYGFIHPSVLYSHSPVGLAPTFGPNYGLPNAPHATHVFSGYANLADPSSSSSSALNTAASSLVNHPSADSAYTSQQASWPAGIRPLLPAAPAFSGSSSGSFATAPAVTSPFSSPPSSSSASYHIALPSTATTTSTSFFLNEVGEEEDMGRYLRSPSSPLFTPAPLILAPSSSHPDFALPSAPGPSTSISTFLQPLLPLSDTSVPRPTDDLVLPLTLPLSPRAGDTIAAPNNQAAPRLRNWRPQEERPIPPRTATTPVHGSMSPICPPFIPATISMNAPPFSSGHRSDGSFSPLSTESDPMSGCANKVVASHSNERVGISIPELPRGVMRTRDPSGEDDDDGSGEYREEGPGGKRRRGRVVDIPVTARIPSQRVSQLLLSVNFS